MVTISAQSDVKDTSFTGIKIKIDKRLKEVSDLITASKIKTDGKNTSAGINSNYGYSGQEKEYAGSISFSANVGSVNDAIKLAEEFEKKGFSIGISSYESECPSSCSVETKEDKAKNEEKPEEMK